MHEGTLSRCCCHCCCHPGRRPDCSRLGERSGKDLGRAGHHVGSCYASTDTRGYELDDDEEEEEEEEDDDEDDDY